MPGAHQRTQAGGVRRAIALLFLTIMLVVAACGSGGKAATRSADDIARWLSTFIVKNGDDAKSVIDDLLTRINLQALDEAARGWESRIVTRTGRIASEVREVVPSATDGEIRGLLVGSLCEAIDFEQDHGRPPNHDEVFAIVVVQVLLSRSPSEAKRQVVDDVIKEVDDLVAQNGDGDFFALGRTSLCALF